MHSFPVPVVHRDLKSSNILVTAEMVGKVADCGESRRVALESTMTHVGTPLWAAPEILRGERYDERVDRYSFGVVISEVMAREVPFSDIPKSDKIGFNNNLVKAIRTGRKRVRNDAGWTAKIRDLIDRCTRLDPGKRPRFEEVAEVLSGEGEGGK